MKSSNFDSLPKTTETHSTSTPPKIPRLESLQHRLQHAKDADGQPIPLLAELLFFLDDPPPGTRDRWQDGADLCASRGIPTSRMSVWRFYRAHILQWRREQNPAPPKPRPKPEQTARLLDQARHLAAQRALEMLNDPHLSPSQLVGLLQNENHRQKLQLARDQFNDRIMVREALNRKKFYERIDADAREEAMRPYRLQLLRKVLGANSAKTPPTTP
jgi:hypothetical protein